MQKEKDLELTARIGKELLTANGRLEARVTALEGELRSARDHITQLRHDLNAKTDLLQVNMALNCIVGISSKQTLRFRDNFRNRK